MLSRIIWPPYELKKVLLKLEENSDGLERICIQAVNYPNVVNDIHELVGEIKGVCRLPISVSCQPLGKEEINRLEEAGVDRVCVPLDAATPEFFERAKGGSYTWEGHWDALEQAQRIFGDRVSTHLIVGLGENEEEMIRTIQLLHDRNITIGLFAFTPIAGTPFADKPKPNVVSYRRIQLARHLIVKRMSKAKKMHFNDEQISDFGVPRDVLFRTIDSGTPFRTSGCPGCNRPFYNESPREPIYNYPRKLASKEITVIRGQLL